MLVRLQAVAARSSMNKLPPSLLPPAALETLLSLYFFFTVTAGMSLLQEAGLKLMTAESDELPSREDAFE